MPCRKARAWVLCNRAASGSAAHLAATPCAVDAAPCCARRVIICGGGIIGAATAYYLTTAKGWHNVTIVDRVGIAAAASGRAGGFLALDWTDGTPMGRLARASFALHQRLAQRFGAEALGYRRVTTLHVAGTVGGAAAMTTAASLRGSVGGDGGAAWVDQASVRVAGVLGTPQTTAQVGGVVVASSASDARRAAAELWH
jgi:glycine/D-amino acid oxidase-like deaminating enzyme